MAEKVIRCPIHNYIEISHIERQLIDSQLFQRLRNIHQQGTAFYTYPGATHSRFEHSLGVMHLSGRICDTLYRKNPKYFNTSKEKVITLLRLIGLLHDIAHGPFSHVSDKILNMQLSEKEQEELDRVMGDKVAHEYIAYKIMREYIPKYLEKIENIKGELYEFLCDNIFRVFVGDYAIEKENGDRIQKLYGIGLKNIFDSKIDSDKMDFLLRDSYIIGFGSSNLDIERIIRYYGINESNNKLLFDRQALSSLEDIIIKRYQEYRWVNFHHTVCFTDEIMSRILEYGTIYGFLNKKLFTLKHFFEICEYDIEHFNKSTSEILPNILDDRTILTKIRKIEDKTEMGIILKEYTNILERRIFYKPLWKVNTLTDDINITIIKNLSEILFEEYKNKISIEKSIITEIENRIKDEKHIHNIIITFKPYRPITITPLKSIDIATDNGPKPIHEISYILNKVISNEYLKSPPLYMPIYIFVTKEDLKKHKINELQKDVNSIIQDEIDIK